MVSAMSGMVVNGALLLLYAVISSAGLYALKLAQGTIGTAFFTGLAFYGVGFLIWYGMLARMPLSVAFPLAAGSLVIASQIVGAVFLDETLRLTHLGGIGLIVAGIAVVFLKT
jgi:multidrug transporter EmrE-like cation transporter